MGSEIKQKLLTSLDGRWRGMTGGSEDIQLNKVSKASKDLNFNKKEIT